MPNALCRREMGDVFGGLRGAQVAHGRVSLLDEDWPYEFCSSIKHRCFKLVACSTKVKKYDLTYSKYITVKLYTTIYFNTLIY